jgi:hypothetical protein
MRRVGSTSETVGTVRTAVNGTVAATVVAVVLAVLNAWRGWELDIDDPLVVLVVVPAAGFTLGAIYRLSRVIADRWRWLGYVLFGIPRPPVYVPDGGALITVTPSGAYATATGTTMPTGVAAATHYVTGTGYPAPHAGMEVDPPVMFEGDDDGR